MKYEGSMKGSSKGSGGVMKNHGNTSSIETNNAQRFDMNRIQERPMMRKGYCMEAYGYKY